MANPFTNLLEELATLRPTGKDVDLDIDSDTLKEQEIKLHNDRYRSDTSDRKWLAKWTAGMVTVWLLLVLGILIFNEKWLICLSENVLLALLGTTTLNVLGLSFIVLRGHFKSNK